MQSPADFYATWWMTDADKRMNPIHFRSDPADIGIRINPEIRIRIPDQILALAESALSECSCWNCSHFPSFEPPPECISHRLRPASPVSSCLAPPSDLLDRRKQSVGRKCAEATPSGVQHHIVWTSQSITK